MIKATVKAGTEKITTFARLIRVWLLGDRASSGADGANKKILLRTSMKNTILSLAVSLCLPTFAAIAQNAPAENAAPAPSVAPAATNAPSPQFGPRFGGRFGGRLGARGFGPLAERQNAADTNAAVPRRLAIIDALDANHDGIIDSNEIAHAVEALKSLDKNNDGQLTADEFRGVAAILKTGREAQADRREAQVDMRALQTDLRAMQNDIRALQTDLQRLNAEPRGQGQGRGGFGPGNGPRGGGNGLTPGAFGPGYGPRGGASRGQDFQNQPQRNDSREFGLDNGSRPQGFPEQDTDRENFAPREGLAMNPPGLPPFDPSFGDDELIGAGPQIRPE